MHENPPKLKKPFSDEKGIDTVTRDVYTHIDLAKKLSFATKNGNTKREIKNNLSTEELLPGGTDDDYDIDHILGDYAVRNYVAFRGIYFKHTARSGSIFAAYPLPSRRRRTGEPTAQHSTAQHSTLIKNKLVFFLYSIIIIMRYLKCDDGGFCRVCGSVTMQ